MNTRARLLSRSIVAKETEGIRSESSSSIMSEEVSGNEKKNGEHEDQSRAEATTATTLDTIVPEHDLVSIPDTVTSVTPDVKVQPVLVPIASGGADSASVASNESPTPSRRETIRARLREREARLTNLVRTASSDSTGSFLVQMANVRDSLSQVEKEKSELEQELNRLRQATDGDDFLKEKMTGIQEGFMKQVKVIQSLEDEIIAKNNEIEHLREEMVIKLRRIVELEFDLETHDVHYTDYANDQFRLGEEALAEIKSRDQDESLNGEDDSKKRLTPRRAQKLISKLLADLDNLEARYKDEKLEGANKMERIRMQNENLRIQANVLKGRLGEGEKDDSETMRTEPLDEVGLEFLRKRVEVLEAKRYVDKEEIRNTERELRETKKHAEAVEKAAKTDLERLRLENDAMKARIKSLETDITGNDPGTAQFALIEKRIRENYDEISKLEASNDIKTRQIASLKKDVARLRVKEIAMGDVQGRDFTKFDTELLRSAHNNVRARSRGDESESSAAGSGGGGASTTLSAAYVGDLQKQLQHAQQQLVKKEQELVIERAKAASTAAGLLARITELQGSKNTDGSTRSSKKGTPLRFYL